MWTTRHGALVGRDTTVVQVDVDAQALGAHQPVDLGLIGDVAETALAVMAELEARGHSATGDRKSTRLNSSHVSTSYAVVCLKKKRLGEESRPDNDQSERRDYVKAHHVQA